MSSIEKVVESPSATVAQIVGIVGGLATDTVKAPRRLSPNLKYRLEQVAAYHDGVVPLHGRLFAQWMSHVFPRECPYPHRSGTTSPMTPDEWIQHTGHADTTASEAEMKMHIKSDGKCNRGEAGCHTGADEELPWSHHEELVAAGVFGQKKHMHHSSKKRGNVPEQETTQASEVAIFFLGIGISVVATRFAMAAGVALPIKGKDL